MADSVEAPPRAKSVRAAAGNLLTKIVVYPLAFFGGVVVDRTLGPHERGVFAFLLLVGNFILPLLTFGFGGAVIYYVSSGKYASREVALSTVLVGLGQGVLTALVAFAGWKLGWLGQTGLETSWGDLWPILAVAPLQGVQLMASRVLFGESRFGVSNWLNIARAGLNPVLLLFFVFVLGRGVGGAVLATVLLNALLTVATLWTLLPCRPAFRIHLGFLREATTYGLKMWIGDVATRSNLRLDQMLLGVFAAPAALGNYSVAVRLSEFLWIGADSVSPVLFNRLAAARTDEERIELTGRVHRVGILAMMVLALGAGVFGWWLIPLAFGQQFADAPLLFELLLPGTVLLYTAKVLTKYFGAVARPEIAGKLGWWSGVAGAALYFALVPLGATIGAAAASTISYGLMSGAAFVLYRRLIAPASTNLFPPTADDLAWAWSPIRARAALVRARMSGRRL